jgi:hypothetical protein
MPCASARPRPEETDLLGRKDTWEAENFARTHWTAQAQSSEASFREATERVTKAIYECYTFDSPYAAQFLYDCCKAATGFIREEPFLSILEHHLATAAGILANWHISEHKLEPALAIVKETWQVLDAKDSRRAMLKMEPALSTSARLGLLCALADSKWRLPDNKQADLVLTPHQQTQAWLSYQERVLSWSQLHRKSADTQRQNVERIMAAGLHVVTCAKRYVPEQVEALIKVFNQWHIQSFGDFGLSVENGHWKDAPGPLPTTPWYWHFEICKIWLALDLDNISADECHAALSELDQLYEGLIGIVKTWHWARANGTYLGGILRDRNWMRAELRARTLKLQVLPAKTS